VRDTCAPPPPRRVALRVVNTPVGVEHRERQRRRRGVGHRCVSSAADIAMHNSPYTTDTPISKHNCALQHCSAQGRREDHRA
jgi:hypothetical protein